MTEAVASPRLADREAVLHALYEAAELEHNLMCTYLYAAFSLRTGAEDGLAPDEAEAVGRWRQALFEVAIEEMAHLAAVWNITSALGGSPRVGRTNFPIDPGFLPASVVVKLAPFNAQTLQHFIYLERPVGSDERDSEAFAVERDYVRGSGVPRLTPMGINYDTVGNFYTALSLGLRTLVDRCGEEKVFCGDPALQISLAEFGFSGSQTGDLPEDCARRVREHRHARRRRAARHDGLALPAIPQRARGAAELPAQAPGVFAGISGGDQSGAAAAAASGGARVDRRRRRRAQSSIWRMPPTA